MKIKDVLVPLDFSPNSLQALQFAMSLVEPEGEIYLLHVLDSDFIARLSESGFSDAESATAKLRQEAEERLQKILSAQPESGPRLDSMIVVGRPFAEILRIAVDLDFEMIVMGIRGQRQGSIEEMLFGSTAEKVLRAAPIPVVCLPPTWVARK